MQRLYGWVIGMLVCLMPALVHAEAVLNLYQQSELVVSQSLNERRQAAAEGLAVVLVRVSGQPQVLTAPEVKAALAAPDRYVEAFRYESGSETLERDGAQVPATSLVFNYSRGAVESLLRQAGLPLWPANRPAVLVWLVTDDLQAGRQLVSLQGNSELSLAVRKEAAARGLPLVAPLLDLEDQVALNADDLWNLDQSVIEEASARYGAGAILVGRYSQVSSGRWLASWTLLHKQDRRVFDAEGETDAEVVNAALNYTSDYLAGIYAISTRGGAAADLVVMDIEQVDGFADYVKALAYLQGLAMVRELEVVAVDSTQVRVALRTEGQISQLQGALELDYRLSLVTPATGSGTVALPQELAPSGSEQNPLRYRWSG